jgi:threonine/homoserine/homoserine lactone efflux protein
MLNLIILAYVAGFIVAIPPGSFMIAAVQRALQFGFRNAFIFSLGSCLADIFYLLVVYFGVSYIFADNHAFRITLLFFSGVLLLFFGICAVRNSREVKVNTGTSRKSEPDTKTFLSGLGLTLLSPVTIVAWLAIGGGFFLLWNRQMPHAKNMSVLLIPVFILGLMTWIGPLLYFVSKVRHFIEEKIIRTLVIAAGIMLIGLGGLSFIYAIREILA